MSPETVRRWADGGRLPARRSPDGARTVDGVALAAFAKDKAAGLHPVPETAVATSVRNSFAGIVTAVLLDEVAARVEVQSGPYRLVPESSSVRVSSRSTPRTGTTASAAVSAKRAWHSDARSPSAEAVRAPTPSPES